MTLRIVLVIRGNELRGLDEPIELQLQGPDLAAQGCVLGEHPRASAAVIGLEVA